ncbi:MAG: VOC family protein [Candidatus Eremiobacteraeota bacterium]|nr:VOC family protein [Candidatus Eremiobacteraeota bacterium]
MLLAHLNLDVADLARATDFYATAFELPVERGESQTTIRWPSFLLVLTPGTPRTSDNFHFGFRLDSREEVDAWFEKLRTRNVPIVAEPMVKGKTYVGRITDPDAYVVEIFAFV